MKKIKFLVLLSIFVGSIFSGNLMAQGDENNDNNSSDSKGNPLVIGGEFLVHEIADVSNGDLLRNMYLLDLNFKKAVDNTEFKATLRSKKDSLAATGYYFNSIADYNDALALPGVTSADTLIQKAGTNGILQTAGGSDFVMDIREAYINQDIYFDSVIEGINFKIGKIIYTWGNSDELKPVDIINPQDYVASFMDGIQKRKIGVVSGNLSININESLSIEGIVIPEFVGSKTESAVFVDKDVVALMSLGSTAPLNGTVPVVLPEGGSKNFTYGARAGISILDVDMNINYFYGYDSLPTVTINPLTGIVVPQYKKIQMIGYDFQRAIAWGIAIRGEVAYYNKGKYFVLTDPVAFVTSLTTGNNGTVEKDYLEYTVGFDEQTLFGISKLYVNLQFNQKTILGYNEALSTEKNIYSVMGGLKYSLLREKMNLDFSTVYNITDKSYGLKSEIGYKITDSYEVTVGSWVMQGDDNTLLGQYDERDNVYLKAKYVF